MVGAALWPCPREPGNTSVSVDGYAAYAGSYSVGVGDLFWDGSDSPAGAERLVDKSVIVVEIDEPLEPLPTLPPS